jgi:hypothetical protein
MLDLVTSTEENHYEAYRLAQMETRKFGEPKVRKLDNPKYREEEEALRKRFTEQVKLEESRFRQWEQHVSGETFCHRKVTEQAAHCRARQAQQGPRTCSRVDQVIGGEQLAMVMSGSTNVRPNWSRWPRTIDKEEPLGDDESLWKMCSAEFDTSALFMTIMDCLHDHTKRSVLCT